MDATPPQQILTESPAMAAPKLKPKAKPSGHVNGIYSDPVGPRPADYEVIRKEGWIAEFLWRAWPVLVVIAGGIFAAGRLSAGIDAIKSKLDEHGQAIIAQGKAMEAFRDSFANFRVEWAAENERRRSMEAITPVPDDRPKIFPAPKKRAYHKPSGLEGLLH